MLAKFTCFDAQEPADEVVVQGGLQSTVPDASISPVTAWNQKKLTMGFSGGGFLLPYHLGVYQGLAIMGIADPSMPMAGSSAGSLVRHMTPHVGIGTCDVHDGCMMIGTS